MIKKFDKNKLKLSFDIEILLESMKGSNIISKNKLFDPLLNLSKDIKDIKERLKSSSQEILYFLYFNMNNIERALYNIDSIIYFDFDDESNNFFLKINEEKIEIEKKNEIDLLFYISLLIKYNKNLVNFSYSFALIKKINSINKNFDSNTIYKKMLISKIILELIKFYKSNQIFEEKNDEEENENLNKIEKENNNIIEKYINYFGNIDLKLTQKNLYLKDIDLIYSEIINILLKSKNYDYDLIEQLDLENINITKTMFNDIFKTLSSNKSFINEYILSDFDDLFDYKKIDFYYILFKYILKNPIYIYYIDFLNEERKTIIKIIHLDQNQLKNLLNNDNQTIDNNFKDKIIYIIKFFTNSDYYVKYINLNKSNILNSKLSDDKVANQNSFRPLENSSYIKDKENNSHREGSMINQNMVTIRKDENDDNQNRINQTQNPLENIQSVDRAQESQENIINLNQKGQNILTNIDDIEEIYFEDIIDHVKEILKYSSITLNINNDKEKKIEYEKMVYNKGFGIIYKKFKIPFKKEKEKKFTCDDYNILFENYKKLIDFLKKIKKIVKTSLSKNKLLIKIYLKEENNKKNNNRIKNIISEYKLANPVSLKDEDEVEDEDKDKYQDEDILNNCSYEGFKFFSKKIADFYNKTPINKDIEEKFKNISSVQLKSDNIRTSTYNNIKEITSMNSKHFISFEKIIGKHKKIAEKIRELNNGSFISGGYNEIIEYDMYFNQKDKDKDNNNYENYYTFFIDKDDVIISQKNKFTFPNKANNKEQKIKFCCRNLLKLRDNKYVICDENGLYFCADKLNNIDKNFPLNKKSYRGGIEITNEIIAITSNLILLKGENKLIFFNSTTKRFITEIEVENYSFTISENNCALMSIPNKNNSKLLLIACKKYRRGDRNGILSLKIKLNNDKGKKFEKFYDTKNFEVYCFCPILKIENEFLLENNNKAKAIETEYFFVGGFDLDRNEGLIKLYKVIYNNEIEKIEIEYIQDIIVKKKNKKEDPNSFKGFKGPISCIIQSSTGKILITCHDGNVYLFTKPKLDLLNQDYNILKKIN